MPRSVRRSTSLRVCPSRWWVMWPGSPRRRVRRWGMRGRSCRGRRGRLRRRRRRWRPPASRSAKPPARARVWPASCSGGTERTAPSAAARPACAATPGRPRHRHSYAGVAGPTRFACGTRRSRVSRHTRRIPSCDVHRVPAAVSLSTPRPHAGRATRPVWRAADRRAAGSMGSVSAPARPSSNRGGDRPRRDGSGTGGGGSGGRGKRGSKGARGPSFAGDQPRPLYTAGGLAAVWSAGIGVAVLMTLTIAGWVAAPHGTFGEDIGDVLRTAVQAWLVGHHVGFGIPGGDVAMLPLGLVVLPGLLLYQAGRWLGRSCELPRLRHLFRAAVAIAGPYAAIAGTLALIGQTDEVRPSMVQALIAGFCLAFIAGGAGVLVHLLRDKGIAMRRLLELMPDRPRSLLVGTLSATATLLATGALLFVVGLGANLGEAVTA